MMEFCFLITQQDIEKYAEVSGDHNPIHLDKEQAKLHGFSGKIAHGMLTMAKVWSVITSNLLLSYDSQCTFELEFSSPVYAGDIVILRVECHSNRLQVEGMCLEKIVFKGVMLFEN